MVHDLSVKVLPLLKREPNQRNTNLRQEAGSCTARRQLSRCTGPCLAPALNLATRGAIASLHIPLRNLTLPRISCVNTWCHLGRKDTLPLHLHGGV
ncbi:hypothetical protein E2C01_044959 [Portunus trituberculatus]|uniref:Uncharacterized protein n=1 Tax=Portunus trituberculatus TaxID=210409 RepID=A0A5B7FTG7_PORTR|nr:hypothetical protein [Portunus trituberculatus]